MGHSLREIEWCPSLPSRVEMCSAWVMYGGVLRVSRLDSRIGGIAHAGLGGVRIYKIGKPQND